MDPIIINLSIIEGALVMGLGVIFLLMWWFAYHFSINPHFPREKFASAYIVYTKLALIILCILIGLLI